MKALTCIRTWMLAGALVVTAIPLLGQSSKPATPDPQQQPQTQQEPQTQNQTESSEPSASSQSLRTFQGTIGHADGNYVLKDSTGVTYQLDDQKKAKEYSGQTVKVSGELDSATNTIHVATMGPAS